MAPLRVLIVDDYDPFLQVVLSILPAERFQIIAQASDGLEAVKKAEVLRPDLILLDIGLPRLNGIEVARTVKGVAPQTAILMLSQEASPEVVEEALKSGALGYVQKPRAQRELLAAIESVLAGKRFVSKGLLDDFVDSATPRAPHTHCAFFFSDDSDLLDGFARFIAKAIRAGSPVMSLVTQAHRDKLIRRLRESRVDVDGAMAKGCCVWLDADETIDEARLTDAVRLLIDAAKEISPSRPSRVAACGELAGRLFAQGKTNEALALELLWSSLVQRFDLDLLCSYPTTEPQSQQSRSAALIHSIVHAA